MLRALHHLDDGIDNSGMKRSRQIMPHPFDRQQARAGDDRSRILAMRQRKQWVSRAMDDERWRYDSGQSVLAISIHRDGCHLACRRSRIPTAS